MGYVKQEGTAIWMPEKEGDTLEGEVTHVNNEGMYGTQYTIKKSDDESIRTPSHKVLQNRMLNAVVGTKVKIEYTGTEAAKITGQNPTTMYNVFFDE